MTQSTKARVIRFNEVRTGIVDARPAPDKARGRDDRPFYLQFKNSYMVRHGKDEWRTWKTYRTREDAEKVQEKKMGELPKWQWRVVP